MKKIIKILILFILLQGCDEAKNIEQEPNSIEDKIIYELSDEITQSILGVLAKKNKLSYKDKDFYIKFGGPIDERYISLSNCDDCKIKEILQKTNRYLRLNNNILLPVAFFPDSFFEIETKNQLGSQLGGATIFELDIFMEKVLYIGTSM